MFKKLVMMVVMVHQMIGMNNNNEQRRKISELESALKKKDSEIQRIKESNFILKTKLNFILFIRRVKKSFKKSSIPHDIVKHASIGAGALLSTLLIDYKAGLIGFKHISPVGMAGNCFTILVYGAAAASMGVVINKGIDKAFKFKNNDKINWFLPSALAGVGGYGMANQRGIITMAQSINLQSISLILAKATLSGAAIHYAHHKWYDNSK